MNSLTNSGKPALNNFMYYNKKNALFSVKRLAVRGDGLASFGTPNVADFKSFKKSGIAL